MKEMGNQGINGYRSRDMEMAFSGEKGDQKRERRLEIRNHM